MRSSPATAALLACSLLAGCLGGFRNEAPTPVMFRISAPKLSDAGTPLAADLLVTVESTAPGLDGIGIAGRWPGLRIDHLAGARWPVRTPTLVESALIESLQDTGRLRSVQGDFGRFSTTHTLALELRRFEADYTAGEPPVAHVGFAVTLGRLSDRQVLASFTVEAKETASENRLGAVVAAIDAAFAHAAGEMAEKTFEAIAADLASQPAIPADVN